MLTITSARAAMMKEKALVCATKYRLASSDSNQLMVRLFEENALWLERAAARLERAGYLLDNAPA